MFLKIWVFLGVRELVTLALILYCNLDRPHRVKFCQNLEAGRVLPWPLHAGAWAPQKKQGLRLHLINPAARNGAPRTQVLTFTCDLSVSGLRTSDRLNNCFRVLEQSWQQLHGGPLLSLGGKKKPNQSQTSFKIYDHSMWHANEANSQPSGDLLPLQIHLMTIHSHHAFFWKKKNAHRKHKDLLGANDSNNIFRWHSKEPKGHWVTFCTDCTDSSQKASCRCGSSPLVERTALVGA